MPNILELDSREVILAIRSRGIVCVWEGGPPKDQVVDKLIRTIIDQDNTNLSYHTFFKKNVKWNSGLIDCVYSVHDATIGLPILTLTYIDGRKEVIHGPLLPQEIAPAIIDLLNERIQESNPFPR